MNRFLKEYIYEILNDTPVDLSTIDMLIENAKAKPTKGHPIVPDGLYHGGKGRYYTTPRGGPQAAAGKLAGQVIDGKWVPEPEEGDTTSPSAATTDKAEPEKDIDVEISGILSLAKTKGELTGLIDALKSKNKEQIQAELDRLKIVVDNNGKLTSLQKGVGSQIFGKREEALQAAQKLQQLLTQYDITIPTEREITISSTEADSLKPQSLGKGTQVAKTKSLSERRGFVVGDTEYKIMPLTPNLLQRLSSAFKKRGMSDEEADTEAKKIFYAISSHNNKIAVLAREIEKYDNAFDEVTNKTELAQALADKVIEASGNNLSDKQKSVLRTSLLQLSQAETTDEFDAQWSGDLDTLRQKGAQRTAGDEEIIAQMLLASGLRPGSIPALCESIEVLRKSIGDVKILIPTRKNFELVDIIVLRTPLDVSLGSLDDTDSLTDDIVSQLQLVNVQVEMLGVKSGVSSGGSGRASAVQTRVALTEFDEEKTKTDLLELVGSTAHTELWDVGTEEEFADFTRNKLEILSDYSDDIIAYYGLEEQVAGKNPEEVQRILFATLSMGTLPRYDSNGKFLGVGMQASAFNNEELTELNKAQLRLYSFLGFASDAIYNRRSRRQGFTNTTYSTSGIKETDGGERMARSVFQFSRSPGKWKNIFRPSYSFTSNLEYTDSPNSMQTLSTRKQRGTVNEVLLEAKTKNSSNSQKPKRPEKPSNAKFTTGGKWYTADPVTGGQYVGKYVGNKWVNATPDEIEQEKEKLRTKGYGRDYRGGQGASAAAQKPTPKTTERAADIRHELSVQDPNSEVQAVKIAGIGEIRASDIMDGLFSRTTIVEIGPDKTKTAVREITDPATGAKIDITTPEGRKHAVEVLTERLNGFALNGTIKKVCDTLADKRIDKGKRTALRKWLGNLGELAGLRDILAAGHEAYLYADSNPKNDIVALIECESESDVGRNIKVAAVSTKSTSGASVGRLDASAATYIVDSLGDKTVTLSGETGEVNIDASDLALAMFGMQKRLYSSATRGDITSGQRFGGTERKIQVSATRRHLYDEGRLALAEKQNREAQSDSDPGGQRTLVSARKISTDDLKIFSDTNNRSYKRLLSQMTKIMEGDSEKAKILIQLLSARLERKLQESDDFRLSDFDEWMTEEIVELLDAPHQVTGQKSEIHFESDMMIASFSAERGYEGCLMVSGNDMTSQIRDKYGKLEDMDTRDKLKSILGWKTDTRGVGLKTKEGGYIDPLQRAVSPVNQLNKNAFKSMQQYLESVCED